MVRSDTRVEQRRLVVVTTAEGHYGDGGELASGGRHRDSLWRF